jgi:TM2 domain-containing membrane protein YozV
MSEQEKTAGAATEAEKSSINWVKLFFISLFLGIFGIDRFYVGKKGDGVIKLLTLGGLGIWYIIDLFRIGIGDFADSSGREIKNTSLQKCLSLLFFLSIIMFVVLAPNPYKEQQELLSSLDYQEPVQKERELSDKQKQKISNKQKEREYDEMYGKMLESYKLGGAYYDNQLNANKICSGSPIQIRGFIGDIGANSYGKYIDLKKISKKEAEIRIFLEDCNWNDKAIVKIKRIDEIIIGGLCYGQTELYGGIKSDVIIGNARILKVNKEFL